MGNAIQKVSEQLCVEKDPELQSLLSAAFVRLSQEASEAKNYQAVNAVCSGMELLLQQRPVLVNDLRPRVGVENRIPEFIEEALRYDPAPANLLVVLRRTSQSGAEHLADRFFRCMRRDECDRMVELVKEMGSPALAQLREILRTGQPRQASGVVGLLSRLDVGTLLELLPTRLPEWNRFYHDIVVRQIAYGAAPDRGRTLLELAEVLDSVVLPEGIDEIGMSGDLTAAPPLLAMARPGESASRSPFVQLKAIESLGRLRDTESLTLLREIVETKKTFGWIYHRELRIAAAQSLSKTDPRYSAQILSDSGIEPAELAIAPLDTAPACPWVRQRRYERMVLSRTIGATIGSSWGKSKILIRELSLGGGMGTKEDNLRIGSEADLEISVGLRSKIRAHVLLRRARVNEVGFEIVSTDLGKPLPAAPAARGSAEQRSAEQGAAVGWGAEDLGSSTLTESTSIDCFAADIFSPDAYLRLPLPSNAFMGTMRVWQCACLVLCSVAVSAQTSRAMPAAVVPGFEKTACPEQLSKEDKTECGMLTVAENRSNPEARAIRLPVVIFRSHAAEPPRDAVLFMVGGPGGSSVANLQSSRDIIFVEDRDYVVLEQRGARKAEPPLECPEIAAPKTEINAGRIKGREANRILADAARKCRNRLVSEGADLSGYNSVATAADIEDLRRALGYDKWDLYGISYSTRLMLTVARDYPDSVRSMLLDSVLPLEVSYDEVSAANFMRSLNLVFDDCAVTAECVRDHGDVRKKFFDLVERADHVPLPLPITDSEAGGKPARIGGSEVVNAIYSGLQSANTIPNLPGIVDEAYRSDFARLTELVKQNLGASRYAWGLRYSVWCSEEFSFEDRNAIAAQWSPARGLGGIDLGTLAPEVCDAWSVPPGTSKRK